MKNLELTEAVAELAKQIYCQHDDITPEESVDRARDFLLYTAEVYGIVNELDEKEKRIIGHSAKFSVVRKDYPYRDIINDDDFDKTYIRIQKDKIDIAVSIFVSRDRYGQVKFVPFSEAKHHLIKRDFSQFLSKDELRLLKSMITRLGGDIDTFDSAEWKYSLDANCFGIFDKNQCSWWSLTSEDSDAVAAFRPIVEINSAERDFSL